MSLNFTLVYVYTETPMYHDRGVGCKWGERGRERREADGEDGEVDVRSRGEESRKVDGKSEVPRARSNDPLGLVFKYDVIQISSSSDEIDEIHCFFLPLCLSHSHSLSSAAPLTRFHRDTCPIEIC